MMKRGLIAIALVWPLLFPGVVVGQDTPASFSGAWDTTYGLLRVQQDGATVSGTYSYGGGSTIQGTIEGRRLTFRYQEPTAAGEGWFEVSPDGLRFDGSWMEDGSSEWYPWTGTRSDAGPAEAPPASAFDGLFETTYGRLRLATADGTTSGHYTYGGGSTVEGTIEGNRLTFSYQEPTVAGEGWFELSADGAEFTGQWHAAGSTEWSSWNGTRVDPEEGVVWLVVLEAPWETSLAENEYAFGDMLRAYFERMPHVRVRHRRIYDRADFIRAAGELGFLAEPVGLLVASHGTAGNLIMLDGLVSARDVGRALRNASNVFAVHFSSCEIIVGEAEAQLRSELGADHYLAVSGYATAVDWSASAIIEFLYLDLILGRGMSPSRAADVVRRELVFSGDHAQDSPLGSAQFRFSD